MEALLSADKTPAQKLRLLWDEILRSGQMVEFDIPVEEIFENGRYHRKATYPAGVIIIGRKHRSEHFNHVAHGKCLLWSSDSDDIQAIEGPCAFPSGLDVRKVVYVVEEMTWVTTHITDATNNEDFEKAHLYPREYELDGICGLAGAEHISIEGEPLCLQD